MVAMVRKAIVQVGGRGGIVAVFARPSSSVAATTGTGFAPRRLFSPGKRAGAGGNTGGFWSLAGQDEGLVRYMHLYKEKREDFPSVDQGPVSYKDLYKELRVELKELTEGHEMKVQQINERHVKNVHQIHKELVDKHHAEIRELQKKLEVAQNESTKLLKATGKLNIRGGLELAVENMRARNLIKTNQGLGKALEELTQNPSWLELAKALGPDKSRARLKDVKKCQVNLYHTFSKEAHGINTPNAIDFNIIEAVGDRVAVETCFILGNIHSVSPEEVES